MPFFVLSDICCLRICSCKLKINIIGFSQRFQFAPRACFQSCGMEFDAFENSTNRENHCVCA